MFIWKCWYDTRKYFFVFLGALLLVPALTLFSQLWFTQDGQSSWVQPASAGVAQEISQTTTMIFLVQGIYLGIFAGLSLGATGIGQEFKNGTLEHLLTRPRSRRYFIWTGWAVGVTELFVMFTLATLAASGSLFLTVGTVSKWHVLMMSPMLLIPAAVSYGLAYLLSILLRGSIHTGAAGVGVLILYGLLGVALDYYWQIELPSWSDLFYGMVTDTWEFPALSVAGWTLVALAFPLAAQWVFERAEI